MLIEFKEIDRKILDKVKLSKGIGINRPGGKWRLAKKIITLIPYYDFFCSLFGGALWIETTLPHAKNYELWNDLDSELTNYWMVIKEFFKEFKERLDEKQIYYLNSEYIYNKVIDGTIQPKDFIDDAILFRYRNKLSRAGKTIDKNGNYRGSTPKRTYKSLYKGTQMKAGDNTRPFKNNDCGLTTPISEDSIKRMRYVIIRTLKFQKAYKEFCKVLEKYNVIDNVFIYCDPPYFGKENQYTFTEKDVNDLIEIVRTTPYMIALSINNHPRYKDIFKDDPNFFIHELKTKYSMNVNNQKEITELLICNYDITKKKRIIDMIGRSDNKNKFY